MMFPCSQLGNTLQGIPHEQTKDLANRLQRFVHVPSYFFSYSQLILPLQLRLLKYSALALNLFTPELSVLNFYVTEQKHSF